jgi:hypothetical protein
MWCKDVVISHIWQVGVVVRGVVDRRGPRRPVGVDGGQDDETDLVDDRPRHRVDIDRGVHHCLAS